MHGADGERRVRVQSRAPGIRNKRAAAEVLTSFLGANGYDLPDESLYDLMIELTDPALSPEEKVERLAQEVRGMALDFEEFRAERTQAFADEAGEARADDNESASYLEI